MTEIKTSELGSKELDAEIKELKERYGNRWLNNFVLHFPGELYRNVFEEATDRANVPYIESSRQALENGQSSPEAFEVRKRDSSPLLLNQTPIDFYRTFDEAIKETNTNIERVKELRKLRGRGTSTEDLNASLEPLYRNLRHRGYNHNDLNS